MLEVALLPMIALASISKNEKSENFQDTHFPIESPLPVAWSCEELQPVSSDGEQFDLLLRRRFPPPPVGRWTRERAAIATFLVISGFATSCPLMHGDLFHRRECPHHALYFSQWSPFPAHEAKTASISYENVPVNDNLWVGGWETLKYCPNQDVVNAFFQIHKLFKYLFNIWIINSTALSPQ